MTEEDLIMEMNNTLLWMYPGNTEQLLSDADARFTADNGAVSVTPDGRLTALAPGNATVTATTTDGSTATCAVKVMVRPEENIRITVPVWGNVDAVTEEQFRWLRDADIDGVMVVGANTVELDQKMLAIARDLWDDTRTRNLQVYHGCYLYGIDLLASDEAIIDHVRRFRYTPALAGYHVIDEPFDPNLYVRILRLIAEHDPNAPGDLNFLPGICYGSYEAYYDRLVSFAQELGSIDRTLSFDNYPFTPAPGSVDENGLFGNFEALRRAGLETGSKTAFYVQAVGSDKYGYRRPSEGVLRYHIAAALAYGFTWIKYYAWYVPGASGTEESSWYTPAIMDHNAQKTELYDAAARLNREVHNVGSVLVHLDAVEVYHTNESAQGVYKKVPDAFFVKSLSGGDAIISHMRHRETGERYLMLVNKDFDHTHTLAFALTDVSALVELDKHAPKRLTVPAYQNGVLTRAFEPGEFALYRISNKI